MEPRRVSSFAAAVSVVVAVVVTVCAAPGAARAQTGTALIIKPFPTELRLDGTATAAFLESGHAKGPDASAFQLSIWDSQAMARLMPGNIASPRVGYNFTFYNIDTNRPGLPGQLMDASVGVAFPLAKFDDWIIAGQVGFGYAGAAPFGDGDAWYGKAGLAAVRKLDDTSGIALVLDYDRNRTFMPDVPLPGIAYTKTLPGNVLLTVGVPYSSVSWEPTKDLRLELGYQLIDDVRARVGYRFAPGWEVFGSAGQRSDAFFRDGARRNDDRLFFEQRRAEVGVTFRAKDAGVGESDLELTVAGGYAWGGAFTHGFDLRNDDLVAKISDEPYVRIGLQLRF